MESICQNKCDRCLQYDWQASGGSKVLASDWNQLRLERIQSQIRSQHH
jgi:hypothetical protein